MENLTIGKKSFRFGQVANFKNHLSGGGIPFMKVAVVGIKKADFGGELSFIVRHNFREFIAHAFEITEIKK